jgi:3-deoxy-D-manno-octulosonic-acid transferase
LFAVVPRHAERRAEVKADLEKAGFEVVLRSAFHPPADPEEACLVIDSTGELRDWTAHATVVVIGKTILGTGGQNPAEAILARRPLLYGPHMENFEPLAGSLVAAGGAFRFEDEDGLQRALRGLLDHPEWREAACNKAATVLQQHNGATARILDLLGAS